MVKIAVDARMRAHGGIGTYLRQILPYLEKSDHEWFVLGTEELQSSIYSLKEQIELPKKIPECDLLWSPHFNVPLFPIKAQKRVVTIHDLYHLDHLSEFSLEKKLYAKIMLSRAVSKADRLITVSEYSKSRLLYYFPEAKNKVEVIYSGCDHLTEERAIPGLPEQFFLFVGNLKPHKNLEAVLDALLERPDFHLVVAGKMSGFIHGVDWQALEKKYPQLKGRLHPLGKISDEQLTWLYLNAQALIFPSFYEGWGLPPVEAMRLGCPVIASNAASIPEACGTAALYFDPKSPQELLQQMDRLDEGRKTMIYAGKQRTSDLLWEKTAEAHIQLFEMMALLARP